MGILRKASRLAKAYRLRAVVRLLDQPVSPRSNCPGATTPKRRWSKFTFHSKCLTHCYASQIADWILPVEARNVPPIIPFLDYSWRNSLRAYHCVRRRGAWRFCICHRGRSHSWTLSNVGTVHTAEMYVVWQALWYCGERKFVLCTDCLLYTSRCV